MDERLRARRGGGARVARSRRRRRCTGATSPSPTGVDLADGRRAFAKTHRRPAAGLLHHRGQRPVAGSGRPGAVPVPEVLAVGDDEPAHLVLEWIDRGAPVGGDRGRPRPCARRAPPRRRRRASGARTAARPAAGRCPNEPSRHLGRVLRHAAACSRSPGWPATAARCPSGRARRPRGRRRPPRRPLPPRRAARPPARRPLGGQPPRRPRGPELAHRPRRPRRAPRVRPGDDAAVRRLRARLLRRLRRGLPPRATAGRSASACTSSRRSPSTPSSSAAATSRPPSRPSTPTDDEAAARPVTSTTQLRSAVSRRSCHAAGAAPISVWKSQ